MPNPWELNSSQEPSLEEQIANLGLQGLATGAISQQKAAKIAKKLVPKKASMTPSLDTGFIDPSMLNLSERLTRNVPSNNPAVYDKLSNSFGPSASNQSQLNVADQQQYGKDTGLSSEAKQKLEESTGTKNLDSEANKSSRFIPRSPEQIRKELEAFNMNPDVREERQGISQMQDMLAMQGAGQDYSFLNPLADYIEAEVGKKHSFRAESEEGLRDKLLTYQQKIQEAKQSLAKRFEDYLGKDKTGTDTSEFLHRLESAELKKRLDEMEKASKAPESQKTPMLSPNVEMTDLRYKEKDLRDSINKSMEPLEAGHQQLSNAREALAKNDYQALTGILSILAKNVGVDAGALSNQDLARWLPATFQGDLAKVSAYLSSNPSQPVPPELTRGLIKLVDLAEKNIFDRYSKNLDRKVMQFKKSASYKNVNVDDIASPFRDSLNDLRPKINSGTKKDASKMSDAELDAIINGQRK